MKKLHIRDYIQFDPEKLNKSPVFSEGVTKTIVLNFRPGQTLPPHHHPGVTVQLLVLEGEGVFTFDDQEVTAQKGDLFFLDGDEKISFRSQGNTSLYAILTKKN